MPPPTGFRGGGPNTLGLPGASFNRRASSASTMFGPQVPPPHKKRSIPNMAKRGSNSSGSGVYGLVIPQKVLEDAEEYSKGKSKFKHANNSHTSVIESSEFYSLCSQDELRSLRRASVLPPLIDVDTVVECNESLLHQTKPCTVVRISSNNPSSRAISLVGIPEKEPSSRETCLQCCRDHDFNAYFHFYLCLGMLGFVVFWLVLMLRIYLPESYWTWSYIW